MAIALESCIMDAIHSTAFQAAAQRHRAEDIALHAFLEQLMAGEYELYGTSPDLQVRVSQLKLLQLCRSSNVEGCTRGAGGQEGEGRREVSEGCHAAGCSCHVSCKQLTMILFCNSSLQPALACQQLPPRK